MRFCSPCLRRMVLALVSVVQSCLLSGVLFLVGRGVCSFFGPWQKWAFCMPLAHLAIHLF